MSIAESEKPGVEGVTEFWFRVDRDESTQLRYRPAVLVECKLNFRSLRAGLNHSEEHNYTAWLPETDLAIDWDTPAVVFNDGSSLLVSPEPDIPYSSGRYSATSADFLQYESNLVDKLVRNERLRIFYNPVFGLFSPPGEPLDSFLALVAEAAIRRVEPELKRLHGRFDLQLEQVREAQLRKGLNHERLAVEHLVSRSMRLFESENRLSSMFSTLAGSVFGETGPNRSPAGIRPDPDERELREDLEQIEQEAENALHALYSEYLTLANEYDVFEIGLQPNNIQVIRSALLWVPISAP
jgi:hypothetical protein